MTAERDMLPEDHSQATLVGRVLTKAGPSPVVLREGVLYDVSHQVPTMADLIDGAEVRTLRGVAIGDLHDLGSERGPHLLAPIDLQCIKACGVTFAVSAIERVIEERARGDSLQAAAIREELERRVGAGIRAVRPGSPEAADLKSALIDAGMWSQYLEVAIGPDAEVFTKAPVLSAVGWGAQVGIRSDSHWNNPEPEVVLVADRNGRVRGATLGNDVNLRDFEGRSALLLGKAKDNNASAAIGPFIRLFDDGFDMDDVRRAEVRLEIEGTDGYRLEGVNRMGDISRDPIDLVQQITSEHQYPDGFVLFLGTLFAPVQDRQVLGQASPTSPATPCGSPARNLEPC